MMFQPTCISAGPPLEALGAARGSLRCLRCFLSPTALASYRLFFSFRFPFLPFPCTASFLLFAIPSFPSFVALASAVLGPSSSIVLSASWLSAPFS